MAVRYRFWAANGVLALALLGAYWGRSLEDAVVANPGFLKKLDLPFRDWKATEGSITPEEARILEPDDVILRTYRGPKGGQVELTVVAGHRKRTVHTPGYCMVGGGWEVTSQGPTELPLPGRSVPAMRAVMTRQGHRLMVAYFFTDGAYCTRAVLRLQGSNLVRRLKGEAPVSALVRIVAPVGASTDATARLIDEFAAATLPAVLTSLRDTRLRA